MFESILFRLLVLQGSLSLTHARTRGLTSPNSYEIAYDKYRESLSCPTHPCTIISCIGDLTGWRYDDMKNDHIAQHYNAVYSGCVLHFLAILLGHQGIPFIQKICTLYTHCKNTMSSKGACYSTHTTDMLLLEFDSNNKCCNYYVGNLEERL